MMEFVLFLIFWGLCGWFAYWNMREDFLDTFGKYTATDRSVHTILSLLGPVSLGLGIFVFFFRKTGGDKVLATRDKSRDVEGTTK